MIFDNDDVPVKGTSTSTLLNAKPCCRTSSILATTILPVITATFGLALYPSPPLVIVTLSNNELAYNVAVASAALPPPVGASISIDGVLKYVVFLPYTKILLTVPVIFSGYNISTC